MLASIIAGCERGCACDSAVSPSTDAGADSTNGARDTAPLIPPLEPWSRTMGGEGEDLPFALDVTDDGVTLVTGTFSNDVELDGAEGTLSWQSQGGADVFVGAWNREGRLSWARTFGGAGEDRGQALGAAADGSLVVAGRFQGSIDHGFTGVVPGNLVGRGSADGFVMRLEADGTLRWARTLGGSGWIEPQSLSISAAGSVLVAGRFAGEVDLDPGQGEDIRTASGDVDGFALLLSAEGEFFWSRVFGGEGLDEITGVELGDAGCQLTGHFSGEVDFDPGEGDALRQSRGFTDVFVVSLDLEGGLRWVRTWGGEFVDQAYGLASMAGGDVVVAGIFVGAVDFDTEAEEGERQALGRSDIFVARLGNDSTTRWVRVLGGTSSDYVYGVSVGPEDRIAATGRFRGTLDFDPSASELELSSTGDEQRPDAFLLELDADGLLTRARVFGGPGLDKGRAVAYGPSGALTLVGSFEESISFQQGQHVQISSSGASDLFLLRLIDLPLGSDVR